MYLHISLIQCCRYLCGNRCIYKTLIFAIADAAVVSATYVSLNLQMLFSLPVMYNCIYILSFLGFKDTSFANLASTSHVFDNVRMLPSKIPHPVLSIPCRYSPQKFCILNPLFLHLADTSRRNFASSTYPFYTLQIHPTEFLHPHFQKIHYHKYLPYSLNSMT